MTPVFMARDSRIAFKEMTAAVSPCFLATGIVERGRADLAAAEHLLAAGSCPGI
jgi:hypothetical protein